MNLAELTRELAERGPRRAYLLAGAEALLRDDALAALPGAAPAGSDPAFGLDRIAASAAPGALVDALNTLPVRAPRRMVVLQEPEAGRGSARALVDAVAGWLEAEPPGDAGTSALVAIASQPDRRARWVKAFGDAVVACEAPTAVREIAVFVR